MAPSPTLAQTFECFIKPKRTKNEALKVIHFAVWDLSMLPVNYMQKGFLYDKPNIPMEVFLQKLRDSLSTTLVHFYSLAGQLETLVDEHDHTRVIFIDCNKGPGARFIHSTLDITISDVLGCKTDVTDPLFDHNNAINHDGHALSLLTVHVVELVDGVFIALSVNHACADGVSFLHFLTSWSKIFMVNNPTILIRQPVYKPWYLDGYGPIKLPYTPADEFIARVEHLPFKGKTFHFSARSIANLKAKANSECGTANKISSFQALAVLVWRCITRARSTPGDKYIGCGFALNNRGRLSPPVSQDYFGNAGQLGMVTCRAGELLQHKLGWAAMRLNEVMKSYSDEKVTGEIQTWMDGKRKLYNRASRVDHRVMFSGSPRFDVYGVEFGMGKAKAAINGCGNKFDGQVFTSAGRQEGSVDLEVCLSAKSMSALELDEELIMAIFNVNRCAL